MLNAFSLCRWGLSGYTIVSLFSFFLYHKNCFVFSSPTAILSWILDIKSSDVPQSEIENAELRKFHDFLQPGSGDFCTPVEIWEWGGEKRYRRQFVSNITSWLFYLCIVVCASGRRRPGWTCPLCGCTGQCWASVGRGGKELRGWGLRPRRGRRSATAVSNGPNLGPRERQPSRRSGRKMKRPAKWFSILLRPGRPFRRLKCCRTTEGSIRTTTASWPGTWDRCRWSTGKNSGWLTWAVSGPSKRASAPRPSISGNPVKKKS